MTNLLRSRNISVCKHPIHLHSQTCKINAFWHLVTFKTQCRRMGLSLALLFRLHSNCESKLKQVLTIMQIYVVSTFFKCKEVNEPSWISYRNQHTIEFLHNSNWAGKLGKFAQYAQFCCQIGQICLICLIMSKLNIT